MRRNKLPRFNADIKQSISVFHIVPLWVWVLFLILFLAGLHENGLLLSIGSILTLVGITFAISYIIKKRRYQLTRTDKRIAIYGSTITIVVGLIITGTVVRKDPMSSTQGYPSQSRVNQSAKAASEKKIPEPPKVDETMAQDIHYREGIKDKVTKVIDGDTIVTDKHSRVHLIGIAAPKNDHAENPQCFSAEATQKLTELTANKTIYLMKDSAYTKNNQEPTSNSFYVYLENGTNIAYQLLKDGYGHESSHNHQSYKWQQKFREAQNDAQKNTKGLWSENTCAGDTISVATRRQRRKEAEEKQHQKIEAEGQTQQKLRAATATRQTQQPAQPPSNPNIQFRSCKEARAAGYSHMRRGQPGYSQALDRDNDGIACDSHR